ncbi:MAG: FAD-dependent thymidylate synthase [Acidithiobacillus sp.]|jgi:thymidylate synthase (FAD)|uniref:FAD-dependent thymidylate synthase n=1 Tax=Acidithiobacillus sp. TaxID=1872118 RepID=UPI00355F4FB5
MVKILNSSFKIETDIDGIEILKRIEAIGRTAYQSESKLLNLYNNIFFLEKEGNKALIEKNKILIQKEIERSNKLYNIYDRYYQISSQNEVWPLLNDVIRASAINFVDMIIKKGHLSVIEHESITVRIICDRGVSHEAVRHRIASFIQESTRYCNYSQDKYGKEIKVIKPIFFDEDEKLSKEQEEKNSKIPIILESGDRWFFHGNVLTKFLVWLNAMELAEIHYLTLLDLGASPQEARSVLPNSLKTELVITANLREWRDSILKLRTSIQAHPQFREISIPLLKELRNKIPIIFDDIDIK